MLNSRHAAPRRHALALAVRPLGASRLPAPDAARARASRAASSSGRISTTRTGDHLRQGERARGRLPRAARGRRAHVARMLTYDDEGFDADQARRATEDAIRAGEADVIYQAYLTDGTWRGFADFLERQPDGTYEPVDTKLARSAKPRTSSSSASTPSSSSGSRGGCPSTSTSSSAPASGRRCGRPTSSRSSGSARERLLGARRRPGAARDLAVARLPLRDLRLPPPLPRPARRTRTTRSLVAGLGRRTPSGSPPPASRRSTGARRRAAADAQSRASGRETFERLRHQAALQLHFTRDGRAARRAPPGRGGARLPAAPAPDRRRRLARPRGPPVLRAGARARVPLRLVLPRRDGDVATRSSGASTATARTPRSSASSTGSRAPPPRYPDLHVYHYAGYERTALRAAHGRARDPRARDRRLAPAGAARRPLPRRQASRCAPASTSYSIKEIEKLYGFVRTAEVAGGDESVVLFEQWLEARRRRAARGDPRLQRGGLPLDGRAPRLAARAAPAGAPLAAAARPARAERGGRGARRGAVRAARGAARRRGGRRHPLAPRAPPLLPPARGEVAVVGVVPPPRARRGRADRGHGHDRRARARRRAGRGRAVARLHVHVPAAGAQDRRTSASIPHDEKTRTGVEVDDERGRRHAPARRRRARTSRCRPALIPPQPIPDWDHRDAVQRFAQSYLDGERPVRARSARLARAAAAAGAARPRAGPRPRSRSTAAYLFVQGPPGLGEDVAGREGRDRAHARGAAGRRHLAQPQGDREPPLRDRARGTRAGLPFRGVKKYTHEEDAFRGRLHRLERRLAGLLDEELPARRGDVVALRAAGLRLAPSTR